MSLAFSPVLIKGIAVGVTEDVAITVNYHTLIATRLLITAVIDTAEEVEETVFVTDQYASNIIYAF